MKLAWDENVYQTALQETERELRIRFTKVGCVLVLTLMPFGSILDWFVYPECFWSIFQARAVCDLLVAPVFLLLWSDVGRRHARILSILLVLIPTVTLCWMDYFTEGVASPYYAGLNLMIIGSCQLLTYTDLEMSVYCCVTVLLYLAACWFHTGEPFDVRMTVNNLYFIILTGVICVTARHFYNRRRAIDFRLQYELDLRNKQLAELDRLKSSFFANVSHELRTPLTLIISPVENLLSRRGEFSSRVVDALELVRKNSQRLLNLINDLLEIVRLEEGRLQLQRKPLRLDELLLGMVDSVRAWAQQNGLSIDADDIRDRPITVFADESRLEKVVLNLLTNAIKFTPSGGRITVRGWRDADAAVVEIADNGIGIPEEDKPYIFDRFRQGGNRARHSQQGLGLGLALAQELVEEHGGQLSVDSVLGKGSTFRIVVPLFAAGVQVFASEHQLAQPSVSLPTNTSWEPYLAGPTPEERHGAEAIAAGDGSRVVVVDDEPDMRRYVASILAEEHAVFQAVDGQSGMDLVRQVKPGVVVLDLMLPEMSGLEVCECLRKDEDLRDLKIIILTARIDEESKIESLRTGADDFLIKPFSAIELKTRVRNLLQASSLQNDLRERNRELAAAMAKLQAMEAQLIQTGKMNALGSLAAGLLHEVLNPLNYVVMATEWAKQVAPAEDSDLRESLANIEHGTQRIQAIISDLRSFAYPEQAGQHRDFSIRDSIRHALQFTAHEMQGVEVDTSALNGDWVTGSPSQITQVFVNLFVNAARAVRPVADQRQPCVRVSATKEDGRLQVRVRDNGVGIAAELIPRVCDPFFTTRDVGEGMGLGLSISDTIIRSHKGTMSIQSEAGNWTEVSFDLALQKDEI